ncbi:Holliday junction ATP-dependent DNA helicase RuvA [Candidatus Tisiphia endosymbiont of Nemotelus uliginosus]|uniref:Holliday junction ATP-dependent DNA helicase RuvA n=1 Tax=Candidatus Tisiphia endosymbiont of Nemotelus uliginosus TaxID=3077926 RepID=UPI0035C91505
MIKNIWIKLKYILYTIIYLIATFIIANIILLETLPKDGQCHCGETPLLIHYVLAAFITGAPIITHIYLKNRTAKIKTKINNL